MDRGRFNPSKILINKNARNRSYGAHDITASAGTVSRRCSELRICYTHGRRAYHGTILQWCHNNSGSKGNSTLGRHMPKRARTPLPSNLRQEQLKTNIMRHITLHRAKKDGNLSRWLKPDNARVLRPTEWYLRKKINQDLRLFRSTNYDKLNHIPTQKNMQQTAAAALNINSRLRVCCSFVQLLVCVSVAYILESETCTSTDCNNIGVYRSGRACPNSWGSFRRRPSRHGRGRRAAVIISTSSAS